MNNQKFINGLVVLIAGLFTSSISSFLGHFAVLGTAIDFFSGFFDGLSIAAFGAAILLMIPSGRTTSS